MSMEPRRSTGGYVPGNRPGDRRATGADDRQTALAAHVAGVLAGRDGEDLDLHVRVEQLGRDDHRLRSRASQFFSRMSDRPIPSHWSTATHRLNVMMPTSGSGIWKETSNALPGMAVASVWEDSAS